MPMLLSCGDIRLLTQYASSRGMTMRHLVIALTFAAGLSISNTGAAAGCGSGWLHGRHQGCQHHGCQRCDETIVVHCYPPQKAPARRDSQFGTESAPVSPPTVIPYQPSFAMGMQMMPMMPMGVMAANFQGYPQPRGVESAREPGKDCRCDETQKARLGQLEKDVKNLADQVDEVVNSVHRNTLALETLLERLDQQGLLEEGTAEVSRQGGAGQPRLRQLQPAAWTATTSNPKGTIERWIQQNRR